MQLDEAIRRRQCLRDFIRLVVGIGLVELRLLRIAAVGIARLQGLEQLNAFVVIAAGDFRFRLGINALRRPIFSLVGFVFIQPATGQ